MNPIGKAGEPGKRTEPFSVLVVDDDEEFLELVSLQLGLIPGVDIKVASSPSQALRLLARNTYELIVSDWSIASSTGPEVIHHADRLLGHREAKTPVLFMSGSEKVGQTQGLSWRNFEPVSFILKRCGPPLIGLVAEHILGRLAPLRGAQTCSI